MRIFLVSFLFLGFLFSCNKEPPEVNQPPKILVSIAPEKFLVKKIAGDTVEVEVIVPSAASPHTYEPTPKQVLSFIESDVFFRIGEEFEIRAVSVLQSHNPQIKIVDLRDNVDLLPLCCHCHHAEGQIDAHDSHIWLSPRLLKEQAASITSTLTELYPQHKDLYSSRLESFLAELDVLDAEIAQRLENSSNRYILVSHPAFAYFCRDYHLFQLSIENEGKDPTAKQLTELLQKAREEQISYIFTQQQYSTKGAELIAQELEAELCMLDPYSENLIENLRQISIAFSQ